MAESTTKPSETGIRFRCECGARLLIAAKYIGQVKHCPKCQKTFTVPSVDSLKTKPSSWRAPKNAPPPSTSDDAVAMSSRTNEETCAVCQCTLLPDDERTLCSACGLPHHTDCWKENLGCSAYGCSEVNALKAGPDLRISPHGLGDHPQYPVPPLQPVSAASTANPPWEFGLLALSVLSFLVGVVSLGLPCLLVGAFLVRFVFLREGRVNWPVVFGSGLVCLIGFASGLVISWKLYFQ